jgi:MATE family multidrug resistance protein
MSSTYVHYGTPSSVPSDYGVLARYASGAPAHEPDSGEHQPLLAPPTMHRSRSRSHEALRSSRTTHAQPHAPYVPVPGTGKLEAAPSLSSISHGYTEATPLLIPRIVEAVDEEEAQEALGDVEPKAHNVYWEELKILAKYTLPILG